MKIKRYLYVVFTVIALGGLAATPALAENGNAGDHPRGSWFGHFWGGMHGGMGGADHMVPGIFGKVTAIDGNNISVAGKQGFGQDAADVTYSVDASNAKINKDGNPSSVSDIAVGDSLMVLGTVNGTDVAAKLINDGMPVRHADDSNNSSDNPVAIFSGIAGNGEPIVAGTVSSVSGSNIVITNKAGTYNIDASSATITKPGVSSPSTSDVVAGDTIIVQGAVNGTNVTATSVIVQNNEQPMGSSGNAPPHKGFFGSIGSFFVRLFGF
ncbi:MAG TPA: hypothetical protein VG694_01315 [Candidatus Paceibacterota bacterium]|jgi:hypothetical protein|nr:hypothetical protein [Candidatus Paceibacterota bacterium]